MQDVRVAVAGCGYWGKNLVRAIAGHGALVAVCDADPSVAASFAEQYECAARTWEEVLASDDVDAVVIAAPAALHRELAIAAVAAGKHVFVEKPIALTTGDARAIVDAAAEHDRVLMVGHLLQYHAAFIALRELVGRGELGELRYIYSNRLNLGKVRREEDSLWSFAPHDLSMVLALAGDVPTHVSARGHSYLNPGIADATMTNLEFASGIGGHVFVSWLHPFKEQKLVVVGSEAMAVFDDLLGWDQKLALYAHNIEWEQGQAIPTRADATHVELTPSEPLADECAHFLAAVRGDHPARTDGAEALRVLEVLERATASMKDQT